MIELNKIYNQDCLEGMKRIPDKSIDMVLCDLPYGTTKNKWDSVINLNLLWIQYERIIKDDGAIVLFAQTPFDKILGASKINMLRYEWIWQKERGSNFFSANKMPMKNHENVMVFSKSYSNANGRKNMVYNPQTTPVKPYRITFGRGNFSSTNYKTKTKGIDEINKTVTYKNPETVLFFKRDRNGSHPTQKPVALFEYLINTYTHAGETVVDNCMGSGTTAIACLNTGRSFIGFEKDKTYYDKSMERIAKHKCVLSLF